MAVSGLVDGSMADTTLKPGTSPAAHSSKLVRKCFALPGWHRCSTPYNYIWFILYHDFRSRCLQSKKIQKTSLQCRATAGTLAIAQTLQSTCGLFSFREAKFTNQVLSALKDSNKSKLGVNLVLSGSIKHLGST